MRFFLCWVRGGAVVCAATQKDLYERIEMEFVAGFVGGLSIFLALYLFYKLLRGGDER